MKTKKSKTNNEIQLIVTANDPKAEIRLKRYFKTQGFTFKVRGESPLAKSDEELAAEKDYLKLFPCENRFRSRKDEKQLLISGKKTRTEIIRDRIKEAKAAL
jgi:G:T-mismatch repair DNA endonuclease (very short patch repair protein)